MKELKLAEVFGWTCTVCSSPGDPITGMCTHCGIYKHCPNLSAVRPIMPQNKKREKREK